MMQARRWRWRWSGCGLLQKRGMCSNIPGMTRKTREKEFEKLVDAEKPYKKVMALKALLTKEPENVLSFAELGKLRAHVGLSRKARFITLISKYPAIFALYRDEATILWFGFSPQAQLLVDQELALIRSYEAIAVQKLRKLLMMSVDRRIRVPKLAHLRRDLGLPADFQSRVIYAYPQYFKVVEEKYRNEDGPVLELTKWDPSLAVTSLETRAKATGEFNSSGEPLFKMSFNKAFRLSMKQKEGIQKFQERIFISPYTDSKDFNKNTPEFEKRQVALLHEILSMTVEKRTIFDYLTHFRKEYRLPQCLLAMALRHNSIFYVSRKGGRFTIFLKEAYDGGSLIEKNEWNIVKENFMILMDNRKLRAEDLAKTSDEKVNGLETAGEQDIATEEEDPEFDALISLCHKIQEGAAMDGKSTAASEKNEERGARCKVMRLSDMDFSSSDEASSSDHEEWDHGVSTGDDEDESFSDFEVHSTHMDVSNCG